jgi:hypothetical protein
MILQNEESQATNGNLVVGQGGHWCTFPSPATFSLLAGGPNLSILGEAAFNLAWVDPGDITTLIIDTMTVTTLDVTTLNAGTGAFSGPIGANGATPPSQAAFPGTATGSDAVVINAIVAILVGLGLCASH